MREANRRAAAARRRTPNGMALRDRILHHTLADENGCWIWQLAPGHWGYGRINIEGRIVGAHRASYEAFVGEIPPDYDVCHKCDVPACVNPDHLFVGTAADNIRDARDKGRLTQGAYKLTAEQVADIRARVAAGEKQIALAREYGIHQSNVSRIANRDTWRRAA